MENLNVEQINDILDKMDFFQGQKAGRYLWNDKPFDVQEQDIANFSRDVALLKNYIKELTEESKAISERYAIQVVTAIELDKQVQKLTEENERLSVQVEMWKSTAYCEKDRVNSIKIDTVRELQERLTFEFDRMHKDNFMTPEVRQWIIDHVAKEAVEGGVVNNERP